MYMRHYNHSLYISNPLFEGQNGFVSNFFLKIQSLFTLDSGINIGLCLSIFENFWKKRKEWPQSLDWCKKVIKSWCENF